MTGVSPLRPTDSELDILRIIWQNGPCSVRQVNDELNRRKRTGYTTTLKLMQIMHEKEFLIREEKGRMHVYTAAIRKEETQNILLDRIVEKAFGGSAMQLVMQALGSHRSTPEELEKLKELIRKLEEEGQ
jgi:BlaI family penicillinase repressor